jgi:hypothetical protein
MVNRYSATNETLLLLKISHVLLKRSLMGKPSFVSVPFFSHYRAQAVREEGQVPSEASFVF